MYNWEQSHQKAFMGLDFSMILKIWKAILSPNKLYQHQWSFLKMTRTCIKYLIWRDLKEVFTFGYVFYFYYFGFRYYHNVVLTIRPSISFLFYCVTMIFDVSFSHVDALFIGGGCCWFNNIHLAGESIVILECRDFTRCIRILVYNLGIGEWERCGGFDGIHGIVIKCLDK